MRSIVSVIVITALIITSSTAIGIGGDFVLSTQEEKPYSLSDSRGKIVVISFGYTFCPDICPTALATISSALTMIGDAAAQVDPLFISVDPDRDTPKFLGEYTRYFHPRLIGLTGDAASIEDIAKRYNVRYQFVGKGQTSNYTIDHTANIYVIDRQGKLIAILPHGLPPRALADSLMNVINLPTD
jgi:protein SCO1/2